jgi:phenylacetate-CoA ligase
MPKGPYTEEIWDEIETRSIHQVQKDSIKNLFPRQLNHILEKSHFYRKKLKSSISSLSKYNFDFLRALPFTEKREVLNDQAAYPPFGSNICMEKSDIIRVHKTSGTTSRAFLIAATKIDVAYTLESGARCFWASGLRPDHTVIHCLNYCMWAGGLTDHLSLEATGATVIPFGVGNTNTLVESIMQTQSNAIHCTPSYLVRLELILQSNFSMKPRDLGLKLGLHGGEGGLEDSNFRRNIEQKWGMKAMNANYGMADVLSMFGAECSLQTGLHFMGQGIILAEIIDTDNLESIPIEAGVIGELVLTNLRKQSQPFLRYRTCDLIEVLSVEKCTCGRGGFRFKVVGRTDDMVVIRGLNIFPGAIASVLNRSLDVLTGEYRMLINKENPVDRLLIEVEIKKGCADSQTLHNRLIKQLSDYLVIKPELRLIDCGRLPRTEGKVKRINRVL